MCPHKVKFGIIGFGIFGEKRLIPGFNQSEFAELVAISKRSLSQAEEKAKQYDIPYAYDNAADLLANKEVEAVFIATPNSLHKADTLLAAGAGKHILLEKPMAMNAAECNEMVKACEDANIKAMIAQCMRFNSTVVAIKEKIDSGVVGDLVSMSAHFFYDGTQTKRKWLFDQKLSGGGPIMDLGVHCLDNLRFLADQEVKEIKAIKEYNLDGSVESKAHILLQFEKKLHATIQVAFEGNYFTALEVIGTEGTMRAEMYNLIETDVKLRLWKNRKTTAENIRNNNCYAAEIDAFAQSILENSPSPIPLSEGLKNQQILDQIL